MLCVFASSALSATSKLLDVRVGTHRQHDRLVMELDHEAKYSINTDVPEKITIRLFDAAASNSFVLPELTKNLVFIECVEAYLIGSTDLELDIAIDSQSDYKLLILDGSPWRLVLDISARIKAIPNDASKPVQREEPEYVPGDKPIETRLAEKHEEPKAKAVVTDHLEKKHEESSAVVETLSEVAHASNIIDSLPIIPEISDDEVVHTEIVDPLSHRLMSDPLDQERISSVLHHYYLAIGDSETASEFSEFLTDEQLVSHDSGNDSEKAGISVALAALVYQMPWLILVVTFLTGLIGGVVGFWITRGSFSFKLPKFKFSLKLKKKAKAVPTEPVAEEIERDIDTLKNAVDQEPKAEKVEVPEPEPVVAAEAGAEEEVSADEEVKETAMERRVKRVLELSKDGSDIENIAKQLEMSQDEVKLILDLN